MNEGTQTDVYSVANAGTEIPIVKIDVGSGTALATFGGTITAVNNLANGTVRISVGTVTTGTLQNLVSGTINALAAGTIAAGTVQTYGLRHADEFATVITTGTNTVGTIRAATAGSAIYVTDLTISVGSATNVEIGNGGTSLPIFGTVYLDANTTLPKVFFTPIRTSAGSALVYKQSTAISPMTIQVGGYVD